MVSAIIAGTVANTVSNTLPVFLTALARSRGLTESQSGLFAMADLGGVAIGSTLCAVFARAVERFNWRRTIAAGVIILIASNLLMAAPTAFLVLFALGLAAGVGAGLVNAVVYSVLAQRGGARAVAIFYAVQIAFGAFGMRALSELSLRYGGAGVFMSIAATSAACLPLCRLVPSRGGLGSPSTSAEQPTVRGWFAASAVFLFYVGFGATYGFLSYMGVAWGGSTAAIDNTLSDVMIVAIASCLLAAVLGSRFGHLIPMLAGSLGTMISIVLMITLKPTAAYFAVAGLFYFAANFASPFLFGTLTDVDRSSGTAMLMGATQMGGGALGPAVAGYLVTNDYVWVNGFALAMFVVSTVMTLGIVMRSKRSGGGTSLG